MDQRKEQGEDHCHDEEGTKSLSEGNPKNVLPESCDDRQSDMGDQSELFLDQLLMEESRNGRTQQHPDDEITDYSRGLKVVGHFSPDVAQDKKEPNVK
jgi:hypothetical protein